MWLVDVYLCVGVYDDRTIALRICHQVLLPTTQSTQRDITAGLGQRKYSHGFRPDEIQSRAKNEKGPAEIQLAGEYYIRLLQNEKAKAATNETAATSAS